MKHQSSATFTVRIIYKVVPWIFILVPFFILATFYSVLPSQILIARDFDGGGAIYGPKSLFTVFRVAAIEVICGLAIELMRRRAEENGELRDHYKACTVLLYTVAFKSLLQTWEIVFGSRDSNIFIFATLSVVLAGILLAVIWSWNAFSRTAWMDLKLSHADILLLAAMLIAYISFAIIPIYVYG